MGASPSIHAGHAAGEESCVDGVLPEISIVMMAGGSIDQTFACIRELRSALRHLPHEVILVRRSDADAFREVPSMSDVVVVESAAGDEPVCAWDEGALVARGRFVCLYQDGVELLGEWFVEMLSVFERYSDCAMLCGKVQYDDGSLCEAGAIFWSDGFTRSYGCGENPVGATYNYVREVDGCTVCPVLLDGAALREVGGLDRRYQSPEYALADLACRFRQRRRRCVFTPAAVSRMPAEHSVARFGGAISPGSDGDRLRFWRSWRAMLSHRHFKNGSNLFRAREHGRFRKYLLFMDHTLPQPERDAGSRAILQTMVRLSAMGFTVKFWPDDQRYDARLAASLEQAGVEILAWNPGVDGFDRFLQDHGEDIDYAILSRPNFAPPYVAALRKYSQARLAYYAHDLHFLRMLGQAEVLQDPDVRKDALHMQVVEHTLWREVDSIIYPSQQEADVVAGYVEPAKVHAVPLYVFDTQELAFERAGADPNLLVFVAFFGHPPNEDAAMWLVDSILPLVRRARPDMSLHLVGAQPTERVRALAGNGVEVTGAVSHERLQQYYRAAGAVIAPVRFGGGVKLKVVEAMAKGVPLATTSIGVQGLPGVDACVEVADDAEGLAEAVVRLVSDQDHASALTNAARKYVAENFSEQAMESALWRALVSTTGAGGID